MRKFGSRYRAAEDLSAYGTGHVVDRPTVWRAGVVFASPHSGATYPQDLLARTRLSADAMRRNEDIFIDHLFRSCVAAGAPFLRANFPRAVVDVNRAPDELLPEWTDMQSVPTARAAAGLGVVPTALSETVSIYETPLTQAEVHARLDRLYHPYHAALRGLLDESVSRFGRALLVDCHSMPGFAPMGARRPDIILGDRFGTSCHPDTLALVRELFVQAGYGVGINYPYAGGFTTTHYGQPKEGVEAIQIEVNRDLYVNPVTLSPKSGFVDLVRELSGIVDGIVSRSRPQDMAAQ